MADAILVRPVRPADSGAWERMRQTLWPSTTGHAQAIARYFSGVRANPTEVLLACVGSGTPVGFIEVSIRQDAGGAASDRVACVDGWFVDESQRGHGVGEGLMAAAEEWGRANRCTELIGGTEGDNSPRRDF